MNIHPTIPALLRSVMSCFARLQTGSITAEKLFQEFHTECSPNDQRLWSNHRIVSTYHHDWWKDRFDILGFQLPILNVSEVMEMTEDHFERLVSHFPVLF